MASLFDTVRTLVHDTAQGLVDAQVTTKVSDMYANFFSAALGVTNDTLKIVSSITAPPPPATPPGP